MIPKLPERPPNIALADAVLPDRPTKGRGAISNRDYSMIMGTTLIYALLIVLANLTVDIMYGFLDPRIKVK